jgi:hypothetical protein
MDEPRRYVVTIRRWNVYRVHEIAAGSPGEAEERGLEIYDSDDDRVEYVDGAVESVTAEVSEE